MSFAEPRRWVDVESAMREWARDNVPSVSRRVFFGYSNGAAMPQIVLFGIAGQDDNALIQCDVWAASKAQSVGVAVELATAADALSRYVYGDVLLHGARVDTRPRWQPDPESDTPRYIVDLTVFATSSSPSPA